MRTLGTKVALGMLADHAVLDQLGNLVMHFPVQPASTPVLQVAGCRIPYHNICAKGVTASNQAPAVLWAPVVAFAASTLGVAG